MSDQVATLNTKQIAELAGTDVKSVRRKLRSLTPERAGKGGQWAIPVEAVDALVETLSNGGGRTVIFDASGLLDEVESSDDGNLELEDEVDA